MHRRLLTIAILVAVLAAISAAPASAKHSCGGAPIDGRLYFGPYRVVIFRGNLSCHTARALIQALVDGKGKLVLMGALTIPGLSVWITSSTSGMTKPLR